MKFLWRKSMKNWLFWFHKVSCAVFAGAFMWVIFNLVIQIRLWIELGK